MTKAPPTKPPESKQVVKPNPIITKPVPRGKAVVIYGPGGIGKTSLLAQLDNVVWFDMDDSLAELGLTDAACAPCGTWDEIIGTLDSDALNEFKVIALDSATKCEELAVGWTLTNVAHEKGHYVNSLEGYGYGKGYGNVFNTWMQLLWSLDRHRKAGRHVVFTAHDCTTTKPNPEGEDWLRYEPRLQDPKSGKDSIRLRLREWADHMLYVGYDIAVQDGKAKGHGSRTIYPVEQPHCMAKSRSLEDPIVYEPGDDALWVLLGMKGGQV